MGLEYADYCKICGERKTKHESGICCRCRRIKRNKVCKICRNAMTANPDGICYECRRKGLPSNQVRDPEWRLDQAIKEYSDTLFILQQRKANIPFANIADMIGIPRSSVYGKYRRALNLSTLPGYYEEDEECGKGEFIMPDFSGEELKEMETAVTKKSGRKLGAKKKSKGPDEC